MWETLTLPDLDRLSRRRGLTAGMLRQAFVDANPSFRPNQVGLVVNERGWLKEVRLCYGLGYRPKRCMRSELGPADAATLKIWRGL